MSVALTEEGVRERRKTVTRRLGWKFLKPGDRLVLCPKVQGRKRRDGTVEPLVRLAEVEVVSVRRERLWDITDEDIRCEAVDPGVFEECYTDTGLPTPQSWIAWFCEQMNVMPDAAVTRIEWLYLPKLTYDRPTSARR
jgi:hypothetical protein